MPDIFDQISEPQKATGDIFDQISVPGLPVGMSLPGISRPVPPGLMNPAQLRAWRSRPLSAGEEQDLATVSGKSLPGVDLGPTIGGAMQMGQGARRIVPNMPGVTDPNVDAPAPGGNWNEVAGGTAQVLGGAMEAATPMLVPALRAAPINTLASLGVGAAAQKGTEAGLEKAGAGEGTRQLLGTLAGVVAGGAVGHPAARRVKAALDEPRIAEASKPAEVPRDIFDSVQPEGRKEVIQSAEPVSPRATLLDSLKRGDGELIAQKAVDDWGTPLPQELGKLRAANPDLTKPQFDAEIIRLADDGKVSLTRVDNPNPTVIDSLVQDPQKPEVYYTAATLREAPGKETYGQGKETGSQTETQGLLKPVTDQSRSGERGAIGAPAPLTPAQQIVRANVAAREKARMGPAGKVRDFVGELYRDIKAKNVDYISPVEDLIAAAQKEHGYEIRPEHDFTNQVDRVLRARSLAGRFVDEAGLAKIIKEVPDIEEFGQYLVAKHARNVEADGFATGRNPATDAVLISELGPKYEPYAKQVQQFDQKLLDYTVDAGLISRELADQLRAIYPDYVPLNRVFTEMEKPDNLFAAGKGVANLSRQTVIQKLKGSEREIENPIGSLLNKTYAALQQGEKNKAARILASYKDLPGFEDLINPTKKIRGDATATFSYLDNGRKVTLQTTPAIEAAVKALDVENLGKWFSILAGPARLYKLGTTGVNPGFFAANIARDQMTAFINSKNPWATSIFNQKLFWKSMWDVMTHDKSYKEMVDAAAGGSSWDLLRQEPMRTAEKIRSERNLGTQLAYRTKNPVQWWRDIENVLARSEEYTRLQQFQGTRSELVREGRTPKDAEILAAKAARENTANFSRRGEWGRVLNASMPYFNASVQGSRAFLRAAGRQPVETFAKTLLSVMFPVAVSTWWNLSDPERAKAYADIRKHEKENTFILIPPNPTQDERGRWNVYKLPVPPGVGMLGTPLRRWIEQAHGMDPVKFGEVAQAMIGSVSPIEPEWKSIKSNLTPQAVKPLLEDQTNQKFFTETPIVPDALKKLPAAQQIHPYTSGTARKIAAPMGISPIRVEEFVKGTMGGAGAQALNLSDNALAAMGVIPKSEVGGTDIPEAVASRFTKAAGGEVQGREFERKAAEKEKVEAAKQTPNQRLIGSMSLRDAIGQFAKLSPPEQADTRAILQKRISKAKGIPPYLLPQLKALGFTK